MMRSGTAPPPPAVALDAVRAGAALAVLLSHARDMLVGDAAAEPALSLAGRAFMAASGFGHQAVIVFFALSGYLVGGVMLRRQAAGGWSLAGFALDRLTRLWVVLVPCLLLGGCLDGIGLAVRGSEAATLPYGIPPVPPALTAAPALGPGVFLGNLVFLQRIAAPTYGSNGALWSLANEAWYYALAGLLFTAWRGRTTPAVATPCIVAAAAIAAVLPSAILQLAPVWACGAAAACWPLGRVRKHRLAATAVACAVVLVASRLRLGPGPLPMDLLLGAATALLLRELVRSAWSASAAAGATVRRLSGFSYSLYASHCPVLALFAALAIGSRPRPLGTGSVALTAAAMVLCLGVAAALGWGVERHTGRCRAALRRWAAGRRAAQAIPVVTGLRP